MEISKNTTVQNIMLDWLEKIEMPHLKPDSYDRKENTCKYQVFPVLGSLPATELTNNDVEGMIQQLLRQGYSYSTIKKSVEAVGGCYRYYRTHGKLTNDPTAGVRIPKGGSSKAVKVRCYNADQLYRPVRISAELDETLGQLAAQRKLSKSEILRELVEEGLKASGKAVDEGHLYELVKTAVEEVTRPSVERLAAISAKATQIDAANFFMFLYTLTRDGSPEEQARIQEAVESARRLGIQYLKLKDRDLDRFIGEGAKQIIDEN